MPQILNFDAVQVETITITKNSHTYQLRDDVPAEIMIRRFLLTPDRYGLAPSGTTEALDAEAVDDTLDGVERMKADTTALLGTIFRWTLPDTTDADLAALFSLSEMFQIIALFTTRLGTASSPPQGATPPTKPATKRMPSRRR